MKKKLKLQKMVNKYNINNIFNIEHNDNQTRNKSRNKSGSNTLETVDFTNKKIRINSPKSRKALLSLGLDEKELYEITMKEYIDSHPELKKASNEVQEKRYNHYNDRRLRSITEAKEMRQKIIEDENEEKNNEHEKEDKQGTQDEIIKKELEKLELIKKQQIGEIKNMIEYEYNQREAYKKNKQKEKEREEKEQKKREERIKLEKEREQKKREEMEKKIEQKKKEEEELTKIYKEQEEKKKEQEKK